MANISPDLQQTHLQPPVLSMDAWMDMDTDYPIGCECADPALQIERWGQEVHSASMHAS